jgi:hypothetical protein
VLVGIDNIGDGHKGLEAVMTGTLKENFLGGPILYQKEKWVNFNKSIIV